MINLVSSQNLLPPNISAACVSLKRPLRQKMVKCPIDCTMMAQSVQIIYEIPVVCIKVILFRPYSSPLGSPIVHIVSVVYLSSQIF